MLFAFVIGDHRVARLPPFRLYRPQFDRRGIRDPTSFRRRRAVSGDVESFTSFRPTSRAELG